MRAALALLITGGVALAAGFLGFQAGVVSNIGAAGGTVVMGGGFHLFGLFLFMGFLFFSFMALAAIIGGRRHRHGPWGMRHGMSGGFGPAGMGPGGMGPGGPGAGSVRAAGPVGGRPARLGRGGASLAPRGGDQGRLAVGRRNCRLVRFLDRRIHRHGPRGGLTPGATGVAAGNPAVHCRHAMSARPPAHATQGPPNA